MSIKHLIFTVFNLLLCVFLLSKAIDECVNFDNWSKVQSQNASQRSVQCFNKPQYGLTYQHGKYWVLSNIRRTVQSADFHCGGEASATMQGYYTDVNNFLRFGASMFDSLRISFAVYVPNQEHALRIVDTMRYMQYCQHENAQLMAIHLYFPQKQYSINVSNLRRELSEPHFMSECNNLGIALANSSKAKLEENANAIIVGRNIAQLEAETLFVLPFADQEIPSTRMMHAIFDFLRYIPRCNETDRLKKTIFFLPSILTKKDLGKLKRLVTYRIRVKEDIIRANEESSSSKPFYVDAGDAEWLNTIQDFNDCSLGRHRISDNLQHLLAFPVHFLTLSKYEFPILEENHQLSVLASLRLRVFELLLKEFEFIKHHRVFVLENVSSFEKGGDFKLSAFNSSILLQYRIMYGPQDAKRA